MKIRLKLIAILTISIVVVSQVRNPIYASTNAKVILQAGKTYNSYDITGDKIADKIKITLGTDKSGEAYNRITITVNGKRAYDNKLKYDSFFSLRAQLYSLENGTKFLYMKASGYNDDGVVCGVFQYKNGKIKQIIDSGNFFRGYGYHTYAEVDSVKKNRMTVKFHVMSYSLGLSDYYYTYEYKNGTLKRTSSKTSKVEYVSYDENYKIVDNGKLTVCIPTNVYMNSNCKKIMYSLTEGEKVKVVGAYVKESVFNLKIKNLSTGKTGWIKGLTDYPYDGLLPFQEIIYAG